MTNLHDYLIEFPKEGGRYLVWLYHKDYILGACWYIAYYDGDVFEIPNRTDDLENYMIEFWTELPENPVIKANKI